MLCSSCSSLAFASDTAGPGGHSKSNLLNRIDNGDDVLVVTNDFHIRRTRLLFGRVLGERVQRLRFIAAPVDGIDAESWWQSEGGFVTYTTEYLKLVQSLAR